jgi:hypothetical protein
MAKEPDLSKLGGLVKLKNLRHESNLVEFKGWKSMHKSIALPMITAMGEHDVPGSNLYIGFAYIDKPEEKIGIKAHIHPDRDQWIMLFGAKDFTEFDADVEFYLDDEWHKIDYPFYAYIPRNMTHEPLRITRVGKPLIFIDARVEPDKQAPVFVEEKSAPKSLTVKKPAAVKKSVSKKTSNK